MRCIEKEDILNYRYLSGLSVSEDGETAVFCVTQARETENNYQHQLWMCSVASKETKALDDTEGTRTFCFLDRDTILYPCLKTEEKKRAAAGEFLTVFYAKNLRTGRTEERFRVPLKNASVSRVRAGLYLLKAVRYNGRPDVESLPEPQKTEELKRLKQEEDFIVCEELPFMSDGQGYINGQRHSLYLYWEREGALVPVTEPWFETSYSAISPDGNYLAYSGVEYDRYYVRTHGIYLYEINTGKRLTLVSPGSYQVMGLDFLEGELAVAAAPWNGEGAFPNHDLYTISLDGGGMKLQYAHRREDFGSKGCSDCKYGAMTTFRTHRGRGPSLRDCVPADDRMQLYYMTTADAGTYIQAWRPG